MFAPKRQRRKSVARMIHFIAASDALPWACPRWPSLWLSARRGMASDRLKSPSPLRAAWRCSKSVVSVQPEFPPQATAPMPKTPSIFCHAARADAACFAVSLFSASCLFVSFTHSNITPHAPDTFRSESSVSENSFSSQSIVRRGRSRWLPVREVWRGIRPGAPARSRPDCKPSIVKLNVSR